MANEELLVPTVDESSAVVVRAAAKSDDTPEDTVNDKHPRGLLMDAVGAVKLTLLNDDAVTLPSGALAAGVIHPIRFKNIWSTGTDAQNIFVVF